MEPPLPFSLLSRISRNSTSRSHIPVSWSPIALLLSGLAVQVKSPIIVPATASHARLLKPLTSHVELLLTLFPLEPAELPPTDSTPLSRSQSSIQTSLTTSVPSWATATPSLPPAHLRMWSRASSRLPIFPVLTISLALGRSARLFRVILIRLKCAVRDGVKMQQDCCARLELLGCTMNAPPRETVATLSSVTSQTTLASWQIRDWVTSAAPIQTAMRLSTATAQLTNAPHGKDLAANAPNLKNAQPISIAKVSSAVQRKTITLTALITQLAPQAIVRLSAQPRVQTEPPALWMSNAPPLSAPSNAMLPRTHRVVALTKTVFLITIAMRIAVLRE